MLHHPQHLKSDWSAEENLNKIWMRPDLSRQTAHSSHGTAELRKNLCLSGEQAIPFPWCGGGM